MKLIAYEVPYVSPYKSIKEIKCFKCEGFFEYYCTYMGFDEYSHVCSDGIKQTIGLKAYKEGENGGIKLDEYRIQCGKCKKIYDIREGGWWTCLTIHYPPKDCISCCGYIGHVEDE